MSENDHFLFVVSCYSKSGLRKGINFPRRIISVYILYPLLLVFYAMVIFNIRYKNNNIFEVTEVFESVSTFGQLLTRKSILLFHGPLFEEIIQDRLQFWNYDTFGEKSGGNFRKEMAFCVSLIKSLWFGSIFSVVFHFCTPFFIANSVLPDACWIPVDHKSIVIFLYTLEIVFYIEVIFLLGSFDAFFLCMCTDLKIQFNLLKMTLDKIDLSGDNSMDKLKMCSKHHNLLLKVHKKLNRFFSGYFVCQYLMNVGGVCIQFFIINNESSNLTQILRSIVYILIASFLGALIFIPSSYIEEEAEIFEQAIYNTNWHGTSDERIPKFIMFWLMKAQETMQMSGAGLFKVNRNVLIQIPRLAFSIATILGNIR